MAHLCCVPHFLVQSCSMDRVRRATVNWKDVETPIESEHSGEKVATVELNTLSIVSNPKPAGWRWSSSEVLWGNGWSHDRTGARRSSAPEPPEAPSLSYAWRDLISSSHITDRNVSKDTVLTLSLTWQESTCSLSRRYSSKHWPQPEDSWEISTGRWWLRTSIILSSLRPS